MEKQCENEVWNMRGNIRKFLSLEMAYKRAYRHLLDAQYRFLIDREIIRTDSENGISYDTWAKWLRSRIVTMFADANDRVRQKRHRSRGLRAPCREAPPRCFS